MDAQRTGDGAAVLTTPCPDDNVLVAFATGELDPRFLAAVATHVDGCHDCQAMVAEAVQAVAELTPSEATPLASPGGSPAVVRDRGPLPRGTMLGRYVVLDLLGSGGLGHVYTAYDPELDRRVAIKLLRSAAGGENSMATARWLLREAQAMAKLSHRHVVPVHDVGTWNDEVFIAMELVSGGTLKAWLTGSTHTWMEIRDVLLDAGHGLQAAHDAGLVHRDFKPTNVLVDEDGGVFVMDFGLARAVGSLEPEASTHDPLATAGDRLLDEALTETGAVVGTPAYMAPEQLLGTAVDARADQFAYCVTLHEALFGTRPFGGSTVRQLYASIVAGPPPGPARPPVPTWMRTAIGRGLAHDAADRFESMEALLHALTRDRRSKRRQWLAIGGAALLSAVVAGGVGFALQPEVTPQQQRDIESTVAAAREAAERACFVYPPADEPEYRTAYAHILELEGIEGPAAALAHAEAKRLRDELASTLVGLGDSYWEREGGQPFASDYYAAAVIFDPQQEQARARMRLTPGQLGALESRAAAASFSSSEVAAADVLAVLAEPDEEHRRVEVARWASRDDVPVATQVQLRRLFPESVPDARAVQSPPVEVAQAEGLSPVSEPSAPSDPDPSVERDGARAARPARREPASPPVEVTQVVARDPKAAKAEVSLGRKAYDRGAVDEAAAHFHRALDYDSRSAGALAGLSAVHFELSQFSKAVSYGERAIRRAPNNAGYHRALGDAYVKVFRYPDARRHYMRAKDLGHPRAAQRLRDLEQKVGAG